MSPSLSFSFPHSKQAGLLWALQIKDRIYLYSTPMVVLGCVLLGDEGVGSALILLLPSPPSLPSAWPLPSPSPAGKLFD